MIDDAKLIEYNSYGFIPGPQEKTSIFLKRVGLLQTGHSCHVGLSLVKSLFGVYPSWVMVKSADQLYFWEAAATYIKADQGIFTPIIYMKEKTISFWCSQEEILAHELVHATRIAFREFFFEEILAYQTSSNWFRRYFGPIFFRPIEAIIFLFLLVTVWICQLGYVFLFDIVPNFCIWIPFMLIGLLTVKLIIAQSIFSLCIRKLRKFLERPEEALKFALRLSDKEILCFALKPINKMQKYILKAQKGSLRWHMLALLYPHKKR